MPRVTCCVGVPTSPGPCRPQKDPREGIATLPPPPREPRAPSPEKLCVPWKVPVVLEGTRDHTRNPSVEPHRNHTSSLVCFHLGALLGSPHVVYPGPEWSQARPGVGWGAEAWGEASSRCHPGDKLQAPGCAPAPGEAALGSLSHQLLPPTLGQNICVPLGNVAPSPGPPQRGFLWPPAFLLGAGPEEHLSSEFTSGSAISPGAPTSYPDTPRASPPPPRCPSQCSIQDGHPDRASCRPGLDLWAFWA